MYSSPLSGSTPVALLVGCAALVLGAGCGSIQRQGDRAFERGEYQVALDYYDEAEATGVKDPEMYHHAAQSALKLGDFAAAEKYYAKALQFGAGVAVARELATFYVKTSNYVSAVRVYQYLLYQEGEKQPLYNNLGTALMYAGQPFDAESYLMIAQQMDPRDPLPYVNLGLLYDRHLKQPWLAVNFYECYGELTQGRADNAQMVRQRAAELRDRYHRLYEPDALACGQPYQPGAAVVQVEDLKEVVAAEFPDRPPDEPADAGPPIENGPVIERQVTEVDLPSDAGTADLLAGARLAYSEGRWADAVKAYAALPLAQLQAQDHKFLGVAYQKQANWAMATHWLELALTQTDDAELVGALFDVYARAGQQERISALCKRFGKSSEYENIASSYCREGGSQ